MKAFLLLTFYCLTVNAFGQRLNDIIFTAQKKAVRTSPYFAAKRFVVPQAQSKFRLTTFPQSVSKLLLGKEHIADTLWIVESFDYMCPDCPSYSCDLFYKDTLYTYDEFSSDSINKTKFRVTKFDNKPLDHYILLEILDSVRQKSNLLSNPLFYGSDGCADGDHTIATIVYPSRLIESLYVRCWTPPDFRTMQ